MGIVATRLPFLLGVALFLTISRADAQELQPVAGQQTQAAPTFPCLKQPPLVRIQDYDGPFAQVVGEFTRKLDRATVHMPRHKPGVGPCSLGPKAKFMLFVYDTIDPFSFANAAFSAALNQAGNNDPTFGQGTEGYAKRFAAEMAGQATSSFFGDFLYPAVFSEDPRYYRSGQGSKRSRLLHAMSHTVVAHHDNGDLMFNYSKWLTTASSVSLNRLYHPGDRPGVTPAVQAGIFSIGQGMGFDVLREFWPEIARELHLPFRGMKDDTPTTP